MKQDDGFGLSIWGVAEVMLVKVPMMGGQPTKHRSSWSAPHHPGGQTAV